MIATNTTEPSGPPDTPPSAFRRDSALSYSSPAPSLSRRPKPRSTAPTLRERFQNSVSSTRPFRRSYPQSPFDSQPDYPHVDEAERSAYDTEAASLRAKVSGFDLKVCEMQRTQRKLNTLFEALRTETEDLRQREEELREQIRSSEGGGESAQADLEMRGDGEAETEETERDREWAACTIKGKLQPVIKKYVERTLLLPSTLAITSPPR
ncbi:hypothetical protein H2203_001194 [Taxawa tesnikishii (nom. ined.)]|nr:hypothetical protein H2203_001194 [Dothideales sp. JES 119]